MWTLLVRLAMLAVWNLVGWLTASIVTYLYALSLSQDPLYLVSWQSNLSTCCLHLAEAAAL